MPSRISPLFLVLSAMFGCAEGRDKSVASTPYAAAEGVVAQTAGRMQQASGPIAAAGLVLGNQAPAPASEKVPAVPRKIIYTADVDLVVEDFPRATEAIAALVAKFGGYVADNDVAGAAGSHRKGSWKVRIPIEKFDGFLDATAKLGELQRRQVHSQDVTEEFYDLSARIKNKKVEEGRLVKHLEESTGKLNEILDVEREISRVREEVERMEGRVRLLANLSDLTTVTITADERIGFVPTTAPTFGTRAARTFEDSVKGLTDSVQSAILFAISILPWLPFWVVGLLITWFLIRRAYRRYPTFFALPRRSRPA